MKKTMSKLIVSLMALIVAATLAVVSSYAWLTISGAPEVDGIQVNIGGSNTIMVAADMTVTGTDGTVYHYPGEFGQELKFAQHESYEYLSGLSGLMPVSTSDGVHWILPAYYAAEDSQVQSGLAVEGQLKNVADFELDRALSRANLPDTEESTGLAGHYIYLDFWVVSPADGYKLRVSTGNENEDSGSFVISLPEPVEADADQDGENDCYVLHNVDETGAASVRIGFLVNQDFARFDDRSHYYSSSTYDSRYTHLMGQYQEPGEDVSLYQAAQNRFTIYEPNADSHPAGLDGDYWVTNPLGYQNSVIAESDIRNLLTVQKTNGWLAGSNGTETLLEQEFKTAMIGATFKADARDEVSYQFFQTRLQGLLNRYVRRGYFAKSTAELYRAAGGMGIVSQENLAFKDTATATDDVYITTLQKDVPQRIRMFIWLEGQDADCANHTLASTFAVNIELAGSNNQ